MSEHQFIIQAKALATNGVTEAKAYETLARSNPALYAAWRENLGNQVETKPVQAKVQTEEHLFIVHAKSMAKASGITEAKAYASLARSNPALYAAWRENLGCDITVQAKESASDAGQFKDGHKFIGMMKALAVTEGGTVALAIAKHKDEYPELYLDWGRWLNEKTAVDISESQRTAETNVLVQAKAISLERGIPIYKALKFVDSATYDAWRNSI